MVPYELFRETVEGAGLEALEVRAGDLRAIVLPGLAGRVFVRQGERILHRFDHASVRRPSTDLGVYNNYGGLNVWPAPEGGAFGWTYTPQGVWHVQPGVNEAPFTIVERQDAMIGMRKETRITNRKGVLLDITMDRSVSVRPVSFAPGLVGCSVAVQDAFHCSPRPDALIAPWTLEQFDTDDEVVAFCKVGQPETAVNFDYYEPPSERIRYRARSLLYATDGRKAGQIGIRRSSRPEFIGMFDPRNRLLVIRKVLGDTESIRSLNIADNEQKNGPFSADDVFSIYNSPESLRFLELETIGGCADRDHGLVPQPLLSETTYVCGPADGLRELVNATLGITIGVYPVESGRGGA